MNRTLANLFAGLVLSVGGLTAGAASACSTTAEYVRPTNFELVQLADAIVVARALSGGSEDDDFNIRFEVRQVLKGDAPENFTDFGSLGAVGPSNPSSLRETHPETHEGPCVRSTFRPGRDYVIFLERNDQDVLRMARYPFARVNEDFTGDNSLWIRTIRRYLEIQSEPDGMVELQVLASLRSSLGQGADDRELAVDITDHLASRSPYKPTPYLVETLERLRSGAGLADGVRSPVADREISAAQDMTDLIFGHTPDGFGAEEQIDFILRALVTGDHPDAAPVFEALLSNPARTTSDLGLAIRFFAKNGQYRRAYGLIEIEVMRTLGMLSPEDRDKLLDAVLDAQKGDSYEEGQERWRTDPYVAAAWPELAMSLYWFMEPSSSDGYSASAYDGALEAIPLTDFRSRPLVTLARPFDEAALTWALAELARPPVVHPERDDENLDRLPLALLVRSYGVDRDAVLNAAFCAGGSRRQTLLSMLGEWGGILDVDLMEGFAKSPELTSEDRTVLFDAVANMHTRHRGSAFWARSRGWFTRTGDDTRQILTDLAGASGAGQSLEHAGAVCGP